MLKVLQGLRIYNGSIWGFPKIRGTLLGIPIIRTIVFWGLYWGPDILGNYHMYIYTYVYKDCLGYYRYIQGIGIRVEFSGIEFMVLPQQPLDLNPVLLEDLKIALSPQHAPVVGAGALRLGV